MGSDDQSSLIIKGKRTKRQRSSSPFGVAATADSSSSGCLGGERSERERGVVVHDFCNSVSSPTTSGEIYESTEEEEEDMANCLIMLAQGDAPRQIQQEDGKINEKFNTSYRKFSSIITNTSNKVGFYMYECKTCNRSFPSFQALGGHRASHKKPKAIMEEKKSSVIVEEVKGVSVKESGQLNKSSSSPPVVPLQVAANSKANKIHECSICGSEFTSGQALGGHMRRHRAAAAAATVNNQVGGGGNSETISNESNSSDHKPQPPTRSILQLDLNLPAPPEDHDHHHLRDSKFQFGSTQQALVFSTPAFVDCHY